MPDAQDRPTPERLLAEQDFVRGVVRSLIHGDEVEDIVQRTWLRAVRRPLPGETGLRPWLARIARNLVFDGHRDAQRRTARERAVAKDEALPSTLDVLAREAERRRVVDAVLALPEPYRGAVLARFWDDTPLAALAKRLDVPDATVRSWLRRGLSMLRTRLDADRDGGRWRAALAPLLFEGGLVVSKSKLAVAVTAVAMIGVVLWWRAWPETVPATPELANATAALRQAELADTTARGAPGDGTVAAADREALAAELLVEVVVTDAGAPAAGLALELRDFAGTGTTGEPSATRAVQTDATGRAALRIPMAADLRTIDVTATEPALRVWCTPLVVAPDETQVVLEATATRLPCTLRGVVRDPSGAPIEGATVSFNGWHEARTDADGRYVLRTATDAGVRPLLAYAPGFRQTLERFAVPKGTREQVFDIVLRPGATITGVVLDADRAPVAGAQVRASGSFVRHTSDQGGRFAIDHLDPDSTHQIDAVSAAHGIAKMDARAGADLELVLARGLRVAGRVRDAQGRPVAGAAILVFRSWSGIATKAWSSLDGTFVVTDLDPGKLELMVRRRAFAPAFLALELAGDRDDLLVDLDEGRTVRGRVLDDAGAPLTGASVYVNLVREVTMRTVGESRYSDQDGRFTHESIPSEPCTIHAWADGWQPVAQPLDGLGDLELELRMQRAASIAGRVVDAATRQPIAEFTVIPSARGVPELRQLEAMRFRDESGIWTMRHSRMRNGHEFDVAVSAPGYAPGRGATVAAAKPDPDGAVIALERGVELVGVVRDATSAAPIADAELSVLGLATRTAHSDADGRFRIADCGHGRTKILVRAPGHPRTEHDAGEIPVRATTHEITVLVGRGVTVRGRLDGFGDLRAPQISLESGDDSARREIAPDGSFAIDGVGPGRHTLYLSGGEPPAVVRNWYVEVGASDPVDLVLRVREGDASLRVTVKGLADGEARVAPLGPPRTPLTLARHHLRFTGGAFSVEGLAPGRYRVRVTGERHEATREIDVDGETTLTVDVPR